MRYCLMFAHDPGTFHFTKKKVVLPTDMSGLKLRPPNAVIASWMRSLGATNVQASAPEIRDVLEKGVAEARRRALGLDGAVRHRQGHEIPHRRADLRLRAGLGAEQGEVRRAVAGAERR